MLSACSACGVAPQPESERYVAAFEVPLPTESDRAEFLALLSQEAKPQGYYVVAANAEEVSQLTKVSPMTIDATVWRGKNDDEDVATVMDDVGHVGLAWLTFAQTREPGETSRFRVRVMRRIMLRWPKTLALPIMPTGSIPLHDDLVLTKDGYRVRAQAASQYELPASSPMVAHN
jgi:hypothetical protein